jgi:hypothetical protein
LTNQYKRPEEDDLLRILREIILEFNDYLYYGLGYKSEQFFISGLALIDIIIRVDKRLDYFRYFHGMKINDRKKAALYAYWIIKLRPVTILDSNLKNDIDHAKVNEKLALNHLLGVLVSRGRVNPWENGVKFDMKNKFFKQLLYSFRFRNFTIDSMIVLAEAINTQSFL